MRTSLKAATLQGGWLGGKAPSDAKRSRLGGATANAGAQFLLPPGDIVPAIATLLATHSEPCESCVGDVRDVFVKEPRIPLSIRQDSPPRHPNAASPTCTQQQHPQTGDGVTRRNSSVREVSVVEKRCQPLRTRPFLAVSNVTHECANYTRGGLQAIAEEDCSFDTHFYVGGVDAKNRQRAQAQGVKPYQYSLAGCVHYMRLNGRPLGLEDALVTKAVSKGCVWKYPCLKEPCVEGADCLQVGIDSFQCVCDTAKICTKKSFTANYKETYATSADDDSPSENVLAVTPVVVHDGGVEHLSPEHIHLWLLRTSKLSVETGQGPENRTQRLNWRSPPLMNYRAPVALPPSPGSVDEGTSSEATAVVVAVAHTVTFTDCSRDVSRYRVVYTHDGSEAANDSVVLEMSVAPSTLLLQRLPKALSEKMQFMLHIAILAQQNSPTHSYDAQVVLTLARHTKKQLTNDLLKIDDVQFVDEGAARFVVHIDEPENTGFVDNFKNPGVAVANFTFHDLKQNLIWFNHRGNGSSASFGLTYSSPSISREILVDIRAFPLDITVVNNTGARASHVTSTIMTNQMLAFVTNAPEQGLDIRFDIVTAPKYGTIQRLKNNSVWTNTTHFSQRQLTRHKVRYVPTPQAALDKPVEDALAFTVSCEKAKLSTLHSFTLSFTSDCVFAATNNTRVIHDTRQVVLTERDLRYLDGHADSRITYTLAATPKLGRLLLNGVVLSVGSNFTQRHLAQKNLVYRPSKSVIFFEDSFKFNVFSSNPATAGLTAQVFTLRSANSDSLIIANMRVPEGERLAFKLAKQASKQKFIIKISGPPSHGAVERSGEKGQFRPAAEFPTEAVAAGEVFYKHDDSESARDKIVYEVVKENSTEVLQTGEVNIDISLKNDNPPRRTQEQVFHIAYQAEKILSSMHLRYEDADTDTDPSKITISRKEIPNAMLVKNDDSRKEVQQFTQKDIDDEMILVRHTGGDYGRAVFWVSDGQFYATGILEIVASPPYLNITTNTGLLLEQGSSAPLLPSNLSVDTNLNVKPSEVVINVVQPPTLGKLRFAQSSEQVINKFTVRDIQEGIIEYVHTSPLKSAHNDRFDFTVVALGVTKDASFKITVYPSTFWTPMQLKAGGGNATLYLDASSTATVSRTYLNVIHETLEPEDVTFSLLRAPRFGQLLINGKPITTFTQADVNKGRVKYAHSGAPGVDGFVVDASNGFSQISGIGVRIGAVLREISLRTQNLTVEEGGQVTITVEYLSLPADAGTPDVISEYIVIEPPKRGTIVTKDKSVVNSFTPNQVKKGEIEYEHNGDERLIDFFTVIGRANALGKETAPATIHVRVQPVNDEVPQIVENTGLELWEGEWAVITNERLAVVDEDTTPEDVRFTLTQSPSNGFVALVTNMAQPILTFTQAEINRNVIVFSHTGPEAGGFKFQVDDGSNTVPGQTFVVKAKEIVVDLIRNERLRVEPGGQQSITSDHLQATSTMRPKNSTAQIIYSLSKEPHFGRVLLEKLDGTLEPIREFTQDQIDQTLVLYENTAATKNDSFVFTVSTNTGKLDQEHYTFVIDVSPKSIMDSPIVVQAKEGDLVGLRSDILSLGAVLPKANISVIRQPLHGWIGLDGPKGVEPTSAFTDDDMNHGRVCYNHDDSETFEDKFVVSVQKLEKVGEPLNISVLIEIEPVNDQPPVLKTEAPAIEIVEGQYTTLTREMLYTEDADNISSQIVYNLDYTDLVIFIKNDSNPVWTFTQQDVDEMRIAVSCNNTEANAVVEINFEVDDGVHSAHKGVLTVTVKPPTLAMAKNAEVILTQGSFYREITNFELDVQTDSRREDCWYDVIQPPENGHIHLFGNNTTVFRQEDVDTGSVQYVQVNNITATEDYFLVDVHCQSTTLKGVRVHVSVIALVNQERLLEVPLHSRGIIGKRHLDSSKVAAKHQSNPRFHITRKPRNGIVGKLGIGPVDQFTHEDVLNSQVYYQSRGGSAPSEDSFEFKLCSPGVQPGKGQLIIVVTRPSGAPDTDEPQPPTTPDVPVSVEVPVPSTTSVSLLELDRSQVHQVILLLSLVAVAIVVISVAFIFLLCKVVRLTTSSSCKSQGDGSNSSTYVSNSGFLDQDEVDRFIAQTAPPPPPQCRVTPIDGLETPVILDYTASLQGNLNTAMQLDCQSGSGHEAEESDSKECGASSPIPVLRKNQYWV
ncbi:chondroitin sulfate proteoglycan 4-like [Tropilaelaps mercedesae]|uniref:Chondroitin sulfate proteoglycan 4-like n=1 Tax=Tropilaelaps mercedesae TaxID=418985 RepID=A0A1V9XH98_9ACAR|nr:chondroitin sulfate proteoglycan 4-like [Tropilaelaps mercedesae]